MLAGIATFTWKYPIVLTDVDLIYTSVELDLLFASLLTAWQKESTI
jgi:hypothetical protein